MNPEQLKEIATTAIDNLKSDLNEISQEIWNNPELCYKEHHAHDVLTKFLEKQGLVVEKGYGGLSTSFRTSYGSDQGPHVAVLCEYDALPGIGHACGHNLIAEVGIGAGLGVKAALEATSKKVGKITILGTPAEEGDGGKVDLINYGAFKSFDAALMAHPKAVDIISPVVLAMTRVDVKYTGKASHAASAPWNGVNALDAAVMCYQSMACMRQQIKPTWRLHGIIKNGGEQPNIIPEETLSIYYLRAPTTKELDELKARATACFKAAATATGCEVHIEFDAKPYANMVTNETIAKLYKTNAESLGTKFPDYQSPGEKTCGSTDMGNVSHEVPSIHPMFYIGSKASTHSRPFATAAAAPEAQPYTITQAKVLAMTAIDIICQPKVMERIKAEFEEQNQQS